MRKPIIVGNWKMNKTVHEAVNLVSELRALFASVSHVDIGVAPGFTALFAVGREIRGTNIQLGAQDVFWEREGPFTGEVSAVMLKDVGCRFVIVGHSERRQYFGEMDGWVNKKIKAALGEGLQPIVCVGESLDQRESGKASSIVGKQIRGCFDGFRPEDMKTIVIAYEPVWAIGTGKSASPEEAQEMHREIRAVLASLFGTDIAETVRLQYGGSVNPSNMGDLIKQPDIDGALVGGASLKADAFSMIVKYGER